VQITLRGVPHSDALERYIAEEARKLDRFSNRIVSCHMIAEKLQAPRPKQFAVTLNLALPGTEVVVNRDHEEDIYMAVRRAFEAAGRQLGDHMSRLTLAAHRARNGKVSPDK